MNAGFIKPLHNSANLEILMKIRSVVPEIGSKVHHLKNKEKNTGKIYSPPDRHAGWAENKSSFDVFTRNVTISAPKLSEWVDDYFFG